MTIKPFAIQGSDLTLGGVNLQAGTTTIVIPGVTQATNYFVEEVNDTDIDQTNTLNLPIVIDNVTHVAKVANASASVVAYATYTVELDDEDYVDEIEVNTAGTYVGSEVDRNGDFDMWGYTGSDAEGYLTNWVTGDWVQIPFRPKMRAGEVENVGGGGVVIRGVEFPAGESGDTQGTIADIGEGTVYYCTQDWTDVNDFNKTFAVENATDFEASQSGFQYNFIDFLAADYPGLQTILDTLNAAGVDYQTDFTVNGGELFGDAQTSTQISSDGTTITVGWPHRTGVDPTTIALGDDFTVVYTGTIAGPAIWIQLSSGIVLDENGNLILPNDIKAGVTGGRFIQDCDDGTTSMRWINVNQGSSTTQLIRVYTGDPAEDNEVERAQIKLNWDETEDKSGLTIRTFDDSDDSSEHNWLFKGDGVLQLPVGGDIVDSNGVSVLGGGVADNNIWVETFTSDAQTIDFVQAATGVEYDADGNVFALFSHVVPTDNDSTYTSVAKLTPAGTVLWQVRFSVNLNSDGWGLAYDGSDSVYVAGKTSGTPLTYEFATLTKIDAISGTIVWSKTYDFEANSQSAVVDVDSDLNPIMVGYADNGTDRLIITTKVDQADGLVIWSKTLDGQGDEEAYGMAVGPTGEVVTIGYADQLGPTDGAATVYTDPVSNVNWVNSANISSGNFSCDVTFADGVPTFTNIVDPTGGRTVDGIIATVSGVSFGGTSPADDMILKVATVAANDTDDRMVVIKYAADGTIAWQKAVQFDAGYDCRGADADIDATGNIYVCGQYQYDYNSYTTSAMSLVKFNSSGVKQWSRRVVGDCDTFATSVVVGPDNNLYLSGVTGNVNQSDYTWVVAKYNTDGVVVWQRLIDNTTTWTFGGTFWFGGAGGGSNIAVKNGYVALAGAFGDPGVQPKATIVQIDTDATEFSVGDWDIKAATFSGMLNDTASDIVVVDAGKTAGTAAPTAADFATSSDSSTFLTATRAGAVSGNSINSGAYSVSVGSNGVVTMVTSRGSLEFGALPEPGGPTHFHIMKAAGDTADLFLGDDFNYVLQRGPAYGGSPAYGVEIGTNDNDGGAQHVWRFGTNGQMTFPQDTVLSEFVSGPTNTFGIFANAVPGRSVTIRTSPGGPNKDWIFGSDGSLSLPGAVVNSTEAKTGVVLPTFTGTVETLRVNTTGSGLTDGSYPFTLGVVSFTVLVVSGTISGFSNVSGTAPITVDDVIGTIDSGDLGGTPGTTITVIVDSVVQETPTALDLTKSINKLTAGRYTLADGVEGQIMYLVPQDGITVAGNVGVSVANFRMADFTGAGGSLLPFRIYNGVDLMDSTGMCTLIFTDNAWQQSGGAWD